MTKEQLKQRLELNSAMTQIAADYLRENACAIEREMVESLCHIHFPDTAQGAWTVRWESYQPFEILIYDDYRVDETGAECPQLGYFNTEYRYPCVYENDVEWMSVIPSEINTMRPLLKQAQGRVLVCGLGLDRLKLGEVDTIFVDLWHNAEDGAPLVQAMRTREPRLPGTRFLYWLETSVNSVLRWDQVMKEYADQ